MLCPFYDEFLNQPESNLEYEFTFMVTTFSVMSEAELWLASR